MFVLGELGLINRGRFLHRKKNIRVMPRGKSIVIDQISCVSTALLTLPTRLRRS